MQNHSKSLKIALIGDCLAGGGAEKVHALLSIYFEKLGHKVSNCVIIDWVAYEFSGTIFNIGKGDEKNSSFQRKISKFFQLKSFIKSNDFDVVIDFRMRQNVLQEFLISKFIYKKKAFYTVHSGVLDFYLPKSNFISRLLYSNHFLVSVSRAIQEKITLKGFKNKLLQVYNPIDIASIDKQKNEYNINENYILAIGRMNDEIKQFDKLIDAYSKSKLPSQNIALVIVGEGKNKEKLIKLSKQLKLEDKVVFKGFVTNPFPYYKNALFTILSSKNEGFPNVLVESLATDTAVVSFDCFSGPNEIIIHGKNGLLIENQNFEALKNAMNTMIDDTELYKVCKYNAKKSIEMFDIENIGNQWLELIKNKVS